MDVCIELMQVLCKFIVLPFLIYSFILSDTLLLQLALQIERYLDIIASTMPFLMKAIC